MTLESRLNDFIAQIPLEQIAADIARQSGGDAGEVKAWLEVYLNEARASLRLVEPYLAVQSRILEVGAGLCILSLFLKFQGYNIIAEEPALAGFDLFNCAKLALLSHYQLLELEVIDRPAGELNLADHGQFDLIFSNNVLEHVADLSDSFTALCSLVSTGGQMVHNCPNYIFPYEPHLHIPVIKPLKGLSESIFRQRVAEKRALWESLNFITYLEVRKMARQAGVNVHFKQALLYEAFERLAYDPLFRERHATSFVFKLYRVLEVTRLIKLLRYIPPALVSPMQFTISRP